MPESKALTIRLSSALYEDLKKRADDEERTVAGVLRLAAKQYLARGEAS